MDDNTLDRADALPVAPESAAVNIRRYLDVHRSGSPDATSVVANLVTGGDGRAGIESAPSGVANPAVRIAIDRLRRHRGSKMS